MKSFWSLVLLVSLLFSAASCYTSACKATGTSQPIQLTDETGVTQTVVKNQSGPG